MCILLQGKKYREAKSVKKEKKKKEKAIGFRNTDVKTDLSYIKVIKLTCKTISE